MGALIYNGEQKSQVEYLEEDNTISANIPQTFQYYPKLYQQSCNDEINDDEVEITQREIKEYEFLYFQTIQEDSQLDIDQSRETPSWNIPQITNNPFQCDSPRKKIYNKKSSTQKNQICKVTQRIHLESVI